MEDWVDLRWWLSAKDSVHLLCTISGKEEITDDINYELNPSHFYPSIHTSSPHTPHLLTPHSSPKPCILVVRVNDNWSLSGELHGSHGGHWTSKHCTVRCGAIYPQHLWVCRHAVVKHSILEHVQDSILQPQHAPYVRYCRTGNFGGWKYLQVHHHNVLAKQFTN